MAFHAVALEDDLWSGEMMGVVVDTVPVLLVNVNGAIHAYEDRCAHQGVRLSEGCLRGSVLTCDAHHWQYDATTGSGVNPRGVALSRFPVRIEAGTIFVDTGGTREPPGLAARGARRADAVGPVLDAGEVADAVVAAIQDLNDSAIAVDEGAYLRVKVPGRCVVTRAAIERRLGRPFQLPGDLEKIMPSFKGRMRCDEREASWTLAPVG